MALVVAGVVADGQVVLVAATALALRLDVLQGGVLKCDMFAAHPARHHAVHLPRHGFVNFDANKRQRTHAVNAP